MGILLYSMIVSADGYVDGPDGVGFDEPDEQVHRFFNEQARTTSAMVSGRRLHEVMDEFWTAPERADGGEVEAEFAREYSATPRFVVSDSLTSVPDGCTLVRRADARAEVARLTAAADGPVEVGGPTLAASLLDLIDEFHLMVVPRVFGGGTPYFPPGADLQLRLVGEQSFAGGSVQLRYRRA